MAVKCHRVFLMESGVLLSYFDEMEVNFLSDLINKIEKDVNDAMKKALKKSVPELKKVFEKSVYNSTMDFYNSAHPKYYKRTYEFQNVMNSTFVLAENDGFYLSVDSGSLNDYPGFSSKNPLNTDTAFDFMFLRGEHGHGIYSIGTTIPPVTLVDNDIASGFNGQIENIILKNFSYK